MSKPEEFYVGQKVRVRDDWDSESTRQKVAPYAIVSAIMESRQGYNSYCTLEGFAGTWNSECLTAYHEPIKVEFREELFEI